MSVWRPDFPGVTSAYLDTAATAHKPRVVIDTMSEAMGEGYASVSRGLYKAAQDMTTRYEAARARIAKFVNAQADEIVFTRNATEALNLVVQSWGRANLGPGDRVLLTAMEHHANIVPWQILQAEKGFAIDIVPIDENGDLDLTKLDALITKTTKIMSFTAASNVLGTINPVADIVAKAKSLHPAIMTCVDASQAVVHGPVDFKALGCDFMAFTGHKLYGPTGIGVLVGKSDILNDMPPVLGGGDMIETVAFSGTTFRAAPHRFEAGTPAFIEAIGLATALDYLETAGWHTIRAHEKTIADALFTMLADLGGVIIVGAPRNRLGIAAFTVDGCHPQDAAMILDQMGVAVRVGHHCAMPLLDALGHKALIRASIGLYTNMDDVAQLERGLVKAQRMLAA